MLARRPQALDAGLFLVVVATPLVFTPFTSAPFADPKLLLLGLGTLLVWVGGVPLDRRIVVPAGAWLGATLLTALTGVDPWRSLTGLEDALTGLGLFTCCAVLVVAGAGLTRERIERIGGWLLWTGVLIAAATLLWRLFPDPVESLAGNLPLRGGTVGNPVFAGAVIACAIAVALVRELSPSRRIAVLVVLASGISAGGERVAWLLPAIALAATLGWARTPFRRSAVRVAVVVGVLAAWALAEPLLPEGTTVSPSAQVGSFETDTGRFTAFAVHTRAFLDRPVFGWGPGATLSAFRATATPDEIDSAGIAWNEAHNLVIQTASQSGIVGLATLIWLVWVLAGRAVHAPRSAAWVIGSVAVLVAFAMFEPFNVTVTPLLFLFAGTAAAPARAWADREASDGGAADGITDPSPPLHGPAPRVAGWAIGALLVGVVVLACLTAVASAYERWGAAYEDQGALRTSRSLQPWRVTAGLVLLEDRALDARSRNVPGAAVDTRRLIDELVGRSGWDPRVRPAAAEAEFLMGNDGATRAWQRAQLARFPGDAAVTPGLEATPSAP